MTKSRDLGNLAQNVSVNLPSSLGSAGEFLTVNSGGTALEFANGFFPLRAWVNFNGHNTPSIRSDGNVASISDNGQGDYTVNFSSNFSDVNYCYTSQMGMSGSSDASLQNIALDMDSYPDQSSASYTMSTSATRLQGKYANAVASGASDSPVVTVMFVR